MTWDEERILLLLQTKFFRIPSRRRNTVAEIEKLVAEIRTEAIGWTWTIACQQHAQGRDPNKQPMPELLEMASADLNPERDKL